MKLKPLNLNGYEARIIGLEQYKEIAKRHNLFTKKWTYGRLKDFNREVQEELDSKITKKKGLFRKFRKR